MNCAQAEKFLPLYASHDLSGSRERLIAAHLQSCAACTEAVADYQTARELMQGFAPPVFGDEVYAKIRQSVWRQIESTPQPSSFERVANWFQPRLVWAATAVLLVTLSVVGVYVLAKRTAVRPDIIAIVPRPVLEPQHGSGNDPGNNSSNPNKKTGGLRQADVSKRQRRPGRIVAPDRSIAVAAYSPGAQIESSSPIIGTDNLDLGSGSSSGALRMELQTQDPNIRIIWFSQNDAKPVAHSK